MSNNDLDNTTFSVKGVPMSFRTVSGFIVSYLTLGVKSSNSLKYGWINIKIAINDLYFRDERPFMR